MQVTIRFGEPFWRVIGQRNLAVEIEPGESVNSLLTQLCEEYPDLTKEFSDAPPSIFVNEEPAQDDSVLTDGAHIHLVWAVSGG
jgi:molybdopterin converting factor small subunit